jgi:hypothetical protein
MDRNKSIEHENRPSIAGAEQKSTLDCTRGGGRLQPFAVKLASLACWA